MHNVKEQIMEIIESLSAIAEENAAAAEVTSVSAKGQSEVITEMAQTSKHLLEMVDEVNNTIDHFKTGKK